MWLSRILLAVVVTVATAVPGYDSYLREIPSWREMILSDPALAAEFGAKFQKATETAACTDKCIVFFGDEGHLLYPNEFIKDPDDPCVVYTCTNNAVTEKNVESECTPVDQLPCDRPVRIPDQCCAQCRAPQGEPDEFTEWGEWTKCSRTCGGGFSARRRECKIENGVAVDCEGKKVEVEECNKDVTCPVNCVVSEWSYSPCSITCTNEDAQQGIMTGSRVILEHPSGGGKPCPPLTEEKPCTPLDECPICVNGYTPCKINGKTECDNDGDCVPRPQDNCENVSNRDQKDADKDGVGDACDNCKYAINPFQENHDADSTGDACDEDDDNDGFGDAPDNCGKIYNPDQSDLDKDGIGDCCDPCTLVRGKCFTPEKTGSTCQVLAQTSNNDKKELAAELMEKLMEMYYSN